MATEQVMIITSTTANTVIFFLLKSVSIDLRGLVKRKGITDVVTQRWMFAAAAL